jgi:hypothetical protein
MKLTSLENDDMLANPFLSPLQVKPGASVLLVLVFSKESFSFVMVRTMDDSLLYSLQNF